MKYTLTKLLYVWYKYLVRQVHIGDWSSGMIGVSKTFGGSSILSSPAFKRPETLKIKFPVFFICTTIYPNSLKAVYRSPTLTLQQSENLPPQLVSF